MGLSKLFKGSVRTPSRDAKHSPSPADASSRPTEGAEVSTKDADDAKALDTTSDPEATEQEGSSHYPKGVALVLIMFSLMTSMFLVALVGGHRRTLVILIGTQKRKRLTLLCRIVSS